jgi:hypothetical protein
VETPCLFQHHLRLVLLAKPILEMRHVLAKRPSRHGFPSNWLELVTQLSLRPRALGF